MLRRSNAGAVSDAPGYGRSRSTCRVYRGAVVDQSVVVFLAGGLVREGDGHHAVGGYSIYLVEPNDAMSENAGFFLIRHRRGSGSGRSCSNGLALVLI